MLELVLVRAESSPGCEFRFGINAESEGCSTNYIKCADGYPNVQQCEPGLAYSDKIKKCTWPDEMLDICNPEGKSSSSILRRMDCRKNTD